MEVDEEDLDFVASVAEIMIISVFFYRKTVKKFSKYLRENFKYWDPSP